MHLCAVNHPNDDTGTCNGDSGGPLIAADSNDNPVELGVTSFGFTDCNTVSADYSTAVTRALSAAELTPAKDHNSGLNGA